MAVAQLDHIGRAKEPRQLRNTFARPIRVREGGQGLGSSADGKCYAQPPQKARSQRAIWAGRDWRLPTRWSVVSESSLAREGNGSDTKKWDQPGPCHPGWKFRNFLEQNFAFSAPRELATRTSSLSAADLGGTKNTRRTCHCDLIAPATLAATATAAAT